MRIIVISAALLSLAACNENHYVPPPAPKVSVAHPLRQEITHYLETSGNLASVNSANLVARVAGFVQEIKFVDGATVKAGQPLFVIEPEPYENALAQAKAAEASADATVTQAQADYVAADGAAKQGVCLKGDLGDLDCHARFRARRAEAETSGHEAGGNQSRLYAGESAFRRHRDGAPSLHRRARRAWGIPRCWRQSSSSTRSTSTSTSSEQDVVRLRAGIRHRRMTEADLRQIPVEVGLVDESGYPHKGTLDYASPGVTSSTGTLAVRGVMPNGDRVLLPGYFVRIRVPLSQGTRRAPHSRLGQSATIRVGAMCSSSARTASSSSARSRPAKRSAICASSRKA